jgi:hypothetical protein
MIGVVVYSLLVEIPENVGQKKSLSVWRGADKPPSGDSAHHIVLWHGLARS